MLPPTDDEIQDFIAKKIAYFRASMKNKNYGQNLSNDKDSTCQSNYIMPKSNSVVSLHTTSGFDENVERQSLSRAAIELCTDAVGRTLQEELTESTLQSKETEYQQIMGNVAATCTKNEDGDPKVDTTVPVMTQNEQTEGQLNLLLDYSSSIEDYKSPWLNTNKNLDDIERMPNVSLALKYTTERENGETGLKPVAEGLDSVQGVSDVSQDLQAISSSVVFDKILIHNAVLTLTKQSEQLLNRTSCEDARENVGSMHSQSDVSLAVSENKVKDQVHVSESKSEEAGSVGLLKDIQFKDFSDDEGVSELAEKVLNKDTEKLSHLSHDLQYEDVSEDENPLRVEDDTDSQMDDDWIVIPISMSDLKFEPKDKDQDSTAKGCLVDNYTQNSETQCDTIPAAATFPIEVFDTIEVFQQVNAVQSMIGRYEVPSDCSTPEHKLDSEEEPHTLQSNREFYSEPEDSCETEDSCDYSPEPEHHYLTVSRQSLKNGSAHLLPETDDSMSEKGEDDEVRDVHKDQTRNLDKLCLQNRRWPTEAKAACQHKNKTNGQKISKATYIINIDTDTEDESDQNYQKKRRKRFFSSVSNDSSDTPGGQQKRHLPETPVDGLCETVKEELQKDRSADLMIPSKLHDTHFKEVMRDACTEVSDSPGKIGQLMETKRGSEKRQKIEKKEIIIISDSDTEDNNDQNYKMANRKKSFSSGLFDGPSVPCVHQKRQSPETVDHEFGTAKEKLIETSLSSADSSLPLHKSQPHDLQFKEEKQDAGSPVSRRGLPIEATGDSEHVQPKTNGQAMSHERRNTKKILSSRSEDSDDALFATKNRPSAGAKNCFSEIAKQRTKNPSQSSGESSKQQLLSVGIEADLSLGVNPAIPRFGVEKCSLPAEYFDLKESRVQKLGNDKTHAPKTPTEPKNTDSCEKNMQHLHRNEKGRFISKPNPANGRHHSTMNENHTNKKPKQVLRQLSLPSQDGPSSSTSSLSSSIGQVSSIKQNSFSSLDLSQSGKTFASCSLQFSRSNSSPSPIDHPCSLTKELLSFTTIQSSAREQVKNDWKSSYHPTRGDRKSNLDVEKDLRTNSYSLKEATPRLIHYDKAPRQRLNWHESETPLMKKTKSDAIQYTKARNQHTPRKQRYSVGDGYKWSEKSRVAKQKKGSSRKGKNC